MIAVFRDAFLAPLAVLLGILCAVSCARAGAIAIVDAGKPASTIVVASDADPKAKLAADELQTYIEKISGAKLPISTDVDGPQGPLILVGKSKLTDEMGIVIPSGMGNSMREEGFVIACKGDRLVLAGNDSSRDIQEKEPRANPSYHGTEYAVYDFLNRLGVRWLMPGEYGEIVPHSTTIKFQETQINEKPAFIMRDWWGHVPRELQDQELRWKIRNKMNPMRLFAVPTDGTANLLIPASKYLKDHPEYFAMREDGTRDPNLPNLASPEAAVIAAETIKDYFRTHPQSNCYAFAPDDGAPKDWSPETLKHSAEITSTIGRPNVKADVSTSEEWFAFVNDVTALVRKEFPDRYIATNGYANRDLPPLGVKLNDHIVVMYADIMSCGIHSYDSDNCWMRKRDGEILRQWCQLSDNVWVYNYESMLVSAGVILPDAKKLSRDFRFMKKCGAIGFFDESRNVWAEYSVLGRYMRARLAWNPDESLDAIYDDFNKNWYGKAAEPMRAFYKRLEDTLEHAPNHGHEDRVLAGMYTPELLTALARDLDEAEKLADTDRDKLHVRADRLIYEYLRGYVMMTEAEAQGDFLEAISWADNMLAVKKDLNAINPFYCSANEEGYESGAGYYCIKDRKAFFRTVADKMSGNTGDLIAMLPISAKFSTDPYEDGMYQGWYGIDFNDAKWKSLLTTKPFYSQGYCDKQGHPYSGYVWYRLKVDVPASASGKNIVLYAPTLEQEGWVWVNGQYVGHRPLEDTWLRPTVMELDVTDAIKPGESNVIAVRVGTSFAPAQMPAGLVSRLFLYAPKAEDAKN